MLKVHEVWHYDNIEKYDPDTKTGGLFTEYINTFLKMKQQADGYPSWCKTDEQKATYIAQYANVEGL